MTPLSNLKDADIYLLNRSYNDGLRHKFGSVNLPGVLPMAPIDKVGEWLEVEHAARGIVSTAYSQVENNILKLVSRPEAHIIVSASFGGYEIPALAYMGGEGHPILVALLVTDKEMFKNIIVSGIRV